MLHQRHGAKCWALHTREPDALQHRECILCVQAALPVDEHGCASVGQGIRLPMEQLRVDSARRWQDGTRIRCVSICTFVLVNTSVYLDFFLKYKY
jgi:hypothetical protein